VVDWPIGEIDEEILNRNNGVWPEMEYKNTVIVPAIIEEVLRADSLVFFTNTGYFSIDDLAMAKKRGFMIVQMLIDRSEMERRNKHRMAAEGYADQSRWFDGMLQYQN